jgi:hypothetical protein
MTESAPLEQAPAEELPDYEQQRENLARAEELRRIIQQMESDGENLTKEDEYNDLVSELNALTD